MRRVVTFVTLIIVALVAFIFYWNYFNVYSNGERKGTLIKITRKGNLFKTYEGEMWLSCHQVVNAEKFLFSIEDKALSDSLQNLQDECLQITYKQYRKTLPWRGDSPYEVTAFKRVNVQ